MWEAGYGIEWYTFTDATRLAAGSVTSSFTFTSLETPAQLAAASPFDNTFQSTSALVYQTAMVLAPPTDPGCTFVVEPACFRAGTNISGADGEVPVEMPRPGDLLLTKRGEARPLRWIGRRDTRCDRHTNPDRVWPACVARGSPGPPSHAPIFIFRPITPCIGTVCSFR